MSPSLTGSSLNADLHSHSVVSDGTLEPEAVAQRAARNGVALWSLTDHDELAGQARARDAALAAGVAWISGVEISVTFAGRTVHVIGLGFDPTDAALSAGLAATRDGREQRAREMAAELAKVGIPDAFEGALHHAGNPALISRTHFGRYLVEIGICKSASEVFRRFLVEGRPGYVPHRWATLGDAVRWITQAGGLAVIAHPARYDFGAAEEEALFSEFKAHGGRGVEVVTASHTRADIHKYLALAQRFGLMGSRGSDFHAPGESRHDLGQVPDLPGGVEPIWSALSPAQPHSAAEGPT